MNEYTNFAVMSYSFHGLKNIGAMDIFGYLESVRYRYGLMTADIWNGMLDSTDGDYIEKGEKCCRGARPGSGKLLL